MLSSTAMRRTQGSRKLGQGCSSSLGGKEEPLGCPPRTDEVPQVHKHPTLKKPANSETSEPRHLGKQWALFKTVLKITLTVRYLSEWGVTSLIYLQSVKAID